MIPETPFSAGIEVRPDPARQGLGVFATREFQAGDLIGFFTGTVTSIRSRMSLQFGVDLFVEPGPENPFRNLNHACNPSSGFFGRDLYALRNLHAGDAVTLDYTCHESELSAPFFCGCGVPTCMGDIRGWRFLTDPQKLARSGLAGDWLTRSPVP